MRAVLLLLPLALAACDPQVMADKATRNMAADVIRPVISRDMPAAPAEAAVNCILDSSTPAEHRAIARDIGVEAGTLTRENIRNIALRPAAESCFAARGVPPVR